jgi:ABC-type transport system involved in multi-copper enzyme maturation permease subunit
MGKTYIIGLTTFKEIVRRPVFWLVAGVSCILFVLFILIPYFTLGEDIKLVKDSGLALFVVAGLIIALFAASVSIAEEIDGKTAITLLSKPITRRNFILGKFLGIMAAIALLFVILTLAFYASLVWKSVYEAGENSETRPTLEQNIDMLLKITPGVVLAYFQVTVLCALSVAFSTRFPVHWNITVCIAIYLLGNIAPQMVVFAQQSGQFPGVEFMARVFGVVFPALGHFNVGPAISTDAVVSWYPYVTLGFVYTLLYTTFALVLAFLLFEDRDLA